ncbi:MAG TPA: hypothetical protein GXX36_16700 [Clostridiaceae bacterium]|nr:hypothetical protein [Clostridiaceae bacterium]
MLKKYKTGFDVWALILFLAVMLPNLYWFAFPAPNDVLRSESVTPVIDMIASISQVLMIGALCIIKRRDVENLRWSNKILAMIICYVIYMLCWFVYYQGYVDEIIIFLLCLAPCLTFVFYALDRKNYIAILPLGLFTICHLFFAIANFII